MTLGAAEIQRSARLVEAARGGSDEAFRELVEPHRRALQAHCYRMLGSLHEAEEVVQETLLRAWRRLDSYAGRASFGAWLYGIATNACLDSARRARVLPSAVVEPDDPNRDPAPPRSDVAWLEPYPDRLLEPGALLEQRESVRLAFVAALQHLPPKQRAVLLLRDVVGWTAQEVADLLGGSTDAVHTALQRARATVATIPPADDVSDTIEGRIVARYLAAWDAADVAALAALLREDVEMAMPPTPSWYRGRAALVAFFSVHFVRFPPGRLLLVPTRANGTIAFAIYDGAEPFGVKVLELAGGAIRSIMGFADPTLVREFVG
jgi:RNA polymerase sigma-70 factor, ECF subfamily